MRHPILLSTMLCLAIASPTLAQSFPAKMTIVLKEAEVRSGPNKQYYATGKLSQGDTVTVLRESKDQPGWYEIEPPKGSFSWINGKYVKQTAKSYAYVECSPSQPAPTYAGSVVNTAQPNREIMKLTGGTALNLIGPSQAVGSETWFPVQPHAGEVRYIPAEAVKPATLIASTNVGSPNWNLSPNGYTGNSVLTEAEKAAEAKDNNRARELFQQVANTTSNQNEKFYALNRVRELSNPQVPATTTSLSPIGPQPTAALQTLNGPAWTAYGRLRKESVVSESGQPLYALDVATSKAPIYVTTIPGKSLDSYIGRMIAVYGPTMYRADSPVRMQFVVASHVAMP
jgi:uncharacterized protein YgiM (DUF1202 family)